MTSVVKGRALYVATVRGLTEELIIILVIQRPEKPHQKDHMTCKNHRRLPQDLEIYTCVHTDRQTDKHKPGVTRT